jgi:hypothetical protein
MRSEGRRERLFVLKKEVSSGKSLSCGMKNVAGVKGIVEVVHRDPNALLFFGVAPGMCYRRREEVSYSAYLEVGVR